VTTGDDEYTIDAGDSQLVPKSANGNMHIKANYNNTSGTYTTNNTYVVAGDKGGKLVMDSDPGTQGVNEDSDPDYNTDNEMQ
jgi:ribosomal protein S11